MIQMMRTPAKQIFIRSIYFLKHQLSTTAVLPTDQHMITFTYVDENLVLLPKLCCVFKY